MTTTITGLDAIRHATAHGLALHKHADPVDGAREVTADEARAIMATQAARGLRLAAADDVLSNNGSRARLNAQIELLHARYLELAARKFNANKVDAGR